MEFSFPRLRFLKPQIPSWIFHLYFYLGGNLVQRGCGCADWLCGPGASSLTWEAEHPTPNLHSLLHTTETIASTPTTSQDFTRLAVIPWLPGVVPNTTFLSVYKALLKREDDAS